MGRVAAQWSGAVLIGVAMLLGCSRSAVARTIARPLIAAEPADSAAEWWTDPEVAAPCLLRLQALDNGVIQGGGPVALVVDRAFIPVPSPHRKLLPHGDSDEPPLD
jgi:hypothetical protein